MLEHQAYYQLIHFLTPLAVFLKFLSTAINAKLLLCLIVAVLNFICSDLINSSSDAAALMGLVPMVTVSLALLRTV